MSISCYCDADYTDFSWWWYGPGDDDFDTLVAKRARRCVSCNARIAPGDTCVRVPREREANSAVEERIHGDAVPLAPWYLCETCGGLAMALYEHHLCYDLGPDCGSLKQQIAEWRDTQTLMREVMEEEWKSAS